MSVLRLFVDGFSRTRHGSQKRSSEAVEFNDDADPVGGTGHAQRPSYRKHFSYTIWLLTYDLIF